VLGLSTLVCLLLFMAYALRPDIAAAVTVFPVWVWVLPGLATQRLCWQRAATRPYKLVLIFGLALWLGLVAVFSEEIWSVPRGLWDRSPVAPRTDRANTLRVVTLNTALNATAAATLAGYEPDIVCLQEITAPEQATRSSDCRGPEVAPWSPVPIRRSSPAVRLHRSPCRPPTHAIS
jgi:hypothetical protein